MNVSNLSAQLHYKIIVECSNNKLPITLAGFDAEEQTEALLCRHLSNLCLQSDGSFLCTQILVSKLMQQWQQSFSMNATQTLKVSGGSEEQTVQSVCLYKTKPSGIEQLINRIRF
ncbi:MAG: hypothetical protein ACOVO1_10805 [Chitinophagaceae bacterium]